jgi:hypothetical protein
MTSTMMTSTMTVDAERSVRDYLTLTRDPDQLIDRDKVAALQRNIEATDDPIERLILRAELESVEQVDRTAIADRFVHHVKEWANERGITAQALIAEGADEGLLRRAGIALPTDQRRRRSTRSKDGQSRVSANTIAAAIPAMGTFTIPQLVARTGASHGTVRKVIADEVEAGRVRQIGTDSTHSGPGRAPALYERA